MLRWVSLQKWGGSDNSTPANSAVSHSLEINMKKTFKLTNEKLNADRLVEAIKHEVRKYIKRERRRKLPDDVDFLDFDCRFGADEASSDVIHLSAIDKSIDWAVSEQLPSFYLEILSRPGHRSRKPKAAE